MSNKLVERQVELQRLYLRNMQEIKWRIEALDEIYSGKKTTRFFQTNVEFCVLQIRKVLELIALSALVSDADIYKEKLGKIEKMWNARLILQDVERIHPDFYPQPIFIDPNDVYNWIDIKDGFLTKEQFIKIYDKCGKMLHESSPFADYNSVQMESKQIWNEIPNWRTLIVKLLNTHIIKLYNQTDLFYITMRDCKNGHPSGNIFSLVTEEKSNGQTET